MSNTRTNIGRHVLTMIFLMVTMVIITAMLTSCGKDSANSSTGLNTQLNIINLSPDVYPLDLYIALRKQNTTPYRYAVPSGYFYLSSLATPLQLRTTTATPTIIFEKNTALSTNLKYTVFITGLVSENTRDSIFVADTAAAPAAGRGKLRFINASARTVNVDVYANGTPAFLSQGIKAVTSYLELPAGVYDLKVYAANSTTVLSDLPNTTIQDGRLYTLYAYGVVGRTDSAAFASGLIVNR